MLRLALFDVGETLIHNGQPFSGVLSALDALAALKTMDDEPLFLGIVSDYYPPPAQTEARILELERRYRDEVLTPSGLTRFFEPFERHVTLSSRAGVAKPDRAIFDLAAQRSGKGATLGECLFVTENASHLAKCKQLGMVPVRFGPTSAAGGSFADWADAPAVLGALVRPTADHPGARMQTTQLVQLHDSRLGALDGVYVELPSQAAEVDPDDVADAVNFVTGLVKTGRVAVPGQPAPKFGVTHVAEKDRDGRLRLVRRGYVAR